MLKIGLFIVTNFRGKFRESGRNISRLKFRDSEELPFLNGIKFHEICK